MPNVTLWGLVVSLALLALGMAYKIAEVGHSLTKSKEDSDALRKSLVALEDDKKKEAACFRAEIDALKDDFDKTISSIKKAHKAEIDKLSKHNDSSKEPEKRMTETHDKILELLFQKPASVEDICKNFKLNREESNYYLYDLYNRELAYPPVGYSSGREEWRLSQEGRKYVMIQRNSDGQKEK